jgi:hypothetical protein
MCTFCIWYRKLTSAVVSSPREDVSRVPRVTYSATRDNSFDVGKREELQRESQRVERERGSERQKERNTFF